MQNRSPFPYFAISILALGLLAQQVAAAAPGSRTSANRWPDQNEVEQMFGPHTMSPVNQHVRAALVAEKDQDFRKAIQEWNEVLRLAPDHSVVYYYRGN